MTAPDPTAQARELIRKTGVSYPPHIAQVLEGEIAAALDAARQQGKAWDSAYLKACPWCAEPMDPTKAVSRHIDHLIRCGDARQAQAEQARDALRDQIAAEQSATKGQP